MAKSAKTVKKGVNDFYGKLDDFVGWMESSGMIGRWKRRREAADLDRNRRRLNRKALEAIRG
ncbi:MAG: hypothetical protein LBD55_09090 [Treponema sp.]|jgi:hypothetical protein|nr:hypothetical protein [Treponema sp.]